MPDAQQAQAFCKPSWATLRGRSEAQPHITIGSRDEFTQRVGVHRLRPANFYVPHAFARALEQPDWIVEARPVEEADFHMHTESIDVTKRRIHYARNRMSIVQKLANVRSAPAHFLEPRQRKPS